jgi:hypothetical protein
MSLFKKLFLIVTVSLITACSNMSLYSSEASSSDMPLAELTEYQVKGNFINFSTMGRGCTFYNNFKVVVVDKKSNSLGVVETHADICRMEPRDVSLQYSFKHLGLDMNKAVHVENSIRQNQANDIVAK